MNSLELGNNTVTYGSTTTTNKLHCAKSEVPVLIYTRLYNKERNENSNSIIHPLFCNYKRALNCLAIIRMSFGWWVRKVHSKDKIYRLVLYQATVVIMAPRSEHASLVYTVEDARRPQAFPKHSLILVGTSGEQRRGASRYIECKQSSCDWGGRSTLLSIAWTRIAYAYPSPASSCYFARSGQGWRRRRSQAMAWHGGMKKFRFWPRGLGLLFVGDAERYDSKPKSTLRMFYDLSAEFVPGKIIGNNRKL